MLYLRNGIPVANLSIRFSFDGDSTSEEVNIADFQVPICGYLDE